MKKNKKKQTYIEKNKIREKNIRVTKTILSILFLTLLTTFIILRVIYETGAFTITLDENFAKKSGLIMYENINDKVERKILKTTKLDFLDNISVNWLPKNIESFDGGNNNGENYIAYTFFLENQGSDEINYWYTTGIDDVIKNVDEAIRVMIYVNDSKTIYAKKNSSTEQAEKDTNEFYSDQYVETEKREKMKPGDIDKITLIIWIEGDDPDCIDSLIGGEMKMHMEITEEHL